VIIFTCIGIGFMIGIFFLFQKILFKLNGFEMIGPVLMQKILFLIFLTFFMMLIFSNTITTISTYYLSNDLLLLFSSPAKKNSIFYFKFLSTVITSSWTVLLLGIPIFLAYATVMKSPWYSYFLIPAMLIPFLMIPASFGILLIMFLVKIYPVKRIKEIAFVISIAFAALLIVYFRYLQPERLANPESFALLGDYLTFLKGPSSPYLPSVWISKAFLGSITGNFKDLIFYFLVLLSNACMLFIITTEIAARIYYPGWIRSQNKTGRKPIMFSFAEKIIGNNSFFKILFLRDIKLFWRDVNQWSQIILFFAIGFIYVFNLRSFRMQTPSTILISFINMGFTGFVIAATGIRFSFPAISMEGKAFWLIKASPAPMKQFLNEKFWTSFMPLLALGETLIIISNLMLKTNQTMFISSIIFVFLFALSLTSLAIGMGAIYPSFNKDNPSEAAGTFGGILYMIISALYVFFMIILMDIPFLSLILHPLSKMIKFDISTYVSILGIIAINFLAVYIPLKKGLKALENYEWK